VILNRRTLLASIGLVLPVVGAQAATMVKKKPVHVTKAAARHPVSRSHHTVKPRVHAQS
jgi:hypothetical protein